MKLYQVNGQIHLLRQHTLRGLTLAQFASLVRSETYWAVVLQYVDDYDIDEVDGHKYRNYFTRIGRRVEWFVGKPKRMLATCDYDQSANQTTASEGR